MSCRMFASAFLCASSLLIGATAAHASDEHEPVVLEPIGPWQLDMAEHKCRLARVFGSEDDRNVFYLEQWGPSDHADWVLAGPAVEKFRSSRDVNFTFGSSGDSHSFEFIETTLGEFGKVISGTTAVVAHAHDFDPDDDEEVDDSANPRGLPHLDNESATEIETISVSQKGRAPISLNLGPMDKPLAAMNICMADLVESWGFDIDEQKTVESPPKVGNLQRVARYVQRYYPSGALRAGAQADFFLRMTIDKSGQIEKCTLVNQTLADGFDMSRHPCAIFARYAQVEPARAADGTPISTYYTSRIVYRMSGS